MAEKRKMMNARLEWRGTRYCRRLMIGRAGCVAEIERHDGQFGEPTMWHVVILGKRHPVGFTNEQSARAAIHRRFGLKE